MSLNEPNSVLPERSSTVVTRRRLTSGLAWAAPVVALGAPARAFAASGCVDPGTYTQTVPGTYTVQIPPTCSTVQYEILGGGGGGAGPTRADGARIAGTLIYPSTGAPLDLTVIVGAPGEGGYTKTTPYLGGVGYGNGGDSGYGSGAAGLPINFSTGAGGGGTAILLGALAANAPIVVAGGGAGGCWSGSTGSSQSCADEQWQNILATSGDATETGNDGTALTIKRTNLAGTELGFLNASGGTAAVGAAGGISGKRTTSTVPTDPSRVTQIRGYNGVNGGGHATGGNGGGNGGRGALPWGGATSTSTTFLGPMLAGPGGGGGYAGGGGGANGYMQDVCGPRTLTAASGAGAGSSYTGGAGGVTVTSTFLTPPHGAGNTLGQPGKVIITWF